MGGGQITREVTQIVNIREAESKQDDSNSQ